MTNIEKLYQSIESEKQRSAWDKGVTKYALELVEQLGEQINGGYFEELDLTEPNKPSEYIYTLCRLEKVGYSSGVYGINGGLVQDTETGTLYAIIGRCTNLFILF